MLVNSAELKAYAKDKYNLAANSLGIISHPQTGKIIAMFDDGQYGSCCKIRCRSDAFKGSLSSFISYTKSGVTFADVFFRDKTDPEAVFRLFDSAVELASLKTASAEGPAAGQQRFVEMPGYKVSVPIPSKSAGTALISLSGNGTDRSRYTDIPLPSGRPSSRHYAGIEPASVPEKIRQMLALCEKGAGFGEEIYRNFVRQGKFMEDYEDNAPWSGRISRFFRTYSDLTIEQLRGYFTWRTGLRKGCVRKTCVSMAYIYVYELLNGIGAGSPEETVRKIEEFEAAYIDSGVCLGKECGSSSGSALQGGNNDENNYYVNVKDDLHRWLYEFAIMNGLDAEIVRKYEKPACREMDRILSIAKQPDLYDDETLCDALLQLSKRKSPVFCQEKGRRLFVQMWRYALKNCEENGRDLFSECFGGMVRTEWRPLNTAVYVFPKRISKRYALNAVRSYEHDRRRWRELSCHFIPSRTGMLSDFVREADRRLRLYLKIRPNLSAAECEQWAEPFIDTVIEADKQAAAQAEHEAALARIKAEREAVKIDFGNLSRIRSDAEVTESLLKTEEERQAEKFAALSIERENAKEGSVRKIDTNIANTLVSAPAGTSTTEQGTVSEAVNAESPSLSLNAVQIHILHLLLEGVSAREYISENDCMPAVAADAVNEAFFDEIGDNIIDCDGTDLSLVEDYREDVSRLLLGVQR